jgi:hypothetical protein
MGVDIRWDVLRPVDVAGSFSRGMKEGREARERRDLQSAMVRLSSNPDDPEARRVVSALSPASLYALEEATHKRGERQRAGEFRSAHTDYLLGGGGAAPNALSPSPTGAPPEQPASANALLGMVAPGAAAPAEPAPQSGGTVNLDGSVGTAATPVPTAQNRPSAIDRSGAWRRMVRADPAGAQKIRGELAKMTSLEVDAINDTNDQALEILATVSDQSSYEVAKERARAMYQQYGQDPSLLDTLPADYSPDTIHSLRTQAMETKDLLAALRQDRKLEWDIQDDEIDNERDDRNVDSQVGYREGQLANTRRGQDLTDSRGRRGQDIGSRDRQRGQDIGSRDRTRGQDQSSADRRRGQDLRRRGRGRAGNAARIINPQTGQAMVLRGNKWVPEK